jgi:hypothetical protein
MTESPTAHPLAWPVTRPRTKHREKGGFCTTKRSGTSAIGTRSPAKPVTLAEARERLARELDRLDARAPILSSNVELRLDGQPRSGQPEPTDPGIAVYFQLRGKPMVMACDRYTEVAQNIAAVAAHIEATRRIERYGVASAEEMFTGFQALPAPMVVDDWRGALGNPRTLAEAEAAYRERIRTAHPDAGGSHAQAAALNAAIARARAELQGDR